MRRSKILRSLQSPVWAITDEALEELRAMIDDDEELPVREDPEDKPDTVALIRLHGPMVARGNWFTRAFGVRSYDDLAASIRAATEDASIKAIVLDFDTGGGACAGLSEVGEAVAMAASVKPTVGVVSHAACSAGYWLATQCSRIVASDTAMVGSIGTVILHADMSKALAREGVNLTFITAGKRKTESHPYKPLSAEAKTHLQGIVDTAHAQFVAAVARGRGVSEETVRSSDWGEGQVMMAPDALRLGMIDEIGNLSSVVDGLLSGSLKVPLKAITAHAEAPVVPVGSSEQAAELLQAQSAVSIAEAMQGSAKKSSYALGDKVRVRHGKDHAGMGKDETGTVKIISSPALGVKFPSAKEVHKWYVDDELEPASAAESSKALANSENPLDNLDTRRAAAEENTMNEDQIKAAIEAGVKAGISAAVDPLTAKITALESSVATANASAEAATAAANEAKTVLADGLAKAQAEALDANLQALEEAGILSPADVASERELLADAKPEKVKARMEYLSAKTPDFKALTSPFVVAKVGDREATINARDFEIHGAAPDPEGLDLVARATAIAGGNSGEHYPAYRKALDQLTGGALGEN